MTTEDEAVDSLEVYNEEQQFWANVKENSLASIKQYKDAIKLAQATAEMAEQKLKEASC